MTLHFLSPRGYEFLRNAFHKNLPHIVTIRRWYQNSQLNAKPGISDCVLEILKKRAALLELEGEKLKVSLSFDEMSIRTQIEWCNESKEFAGLVKYTRNDSRLKDDVDDNSQVADDPNKKEKSSVPSTVAKFALVFMVNGINDFIQIPVAYYFVNSTLGCDKKVQRIIEQITKCGVQVLL